MTHSQLHNSMDEKLTIKPANSALAANAKILLVKHSKGWDCDRCSCWMQQNEIDFDWSYPADGDSFPNPQNYSGIISFGGAASANDCKSLEWIEQELRFIETCMKHELRFFGICLGAQLLARVMGARVMPHDDKIREVGFHRVDPTPQSGQFLQKPMMMMQWHSEGFELPECASCTAGGEVFPHQAFHLSEHVFGVQFHPEVNPQSLAVWHERNKTRPSGVLTEEQRQDMMKDAKRYDESISEWLDGVLQRWVATT